MDRNFLEFWGNMLLTTARGQKQMEDFSKVMKGGFCGFQDMNEMFGSFSGFNALTRSSIEYLKVFTRATEEFQKSFKEFLTLMDLVPRKDYLSLQEEYEALKKRTEEKKENKMDKILGEELSLQTQGLRSFEELMRNQTKQFQDLMSNFTEMLSQTKPVPPAENVEQKSKKGVQPRRKPSGAPFKSPSATQETKK